MVLKTGEALLLAKAYNGRVVLSWLSDLLQNVQSDHPENNELVLESVAMCCGCTFDIVLAHFVVEELLGDYGN